jgi:hypothetical protein
MSGTNSDRLRLRSNNVILAKNVELMADGHPFCEGTYLSHTRGNNSHRHLRTCDITDSPPQESRSTPAQVLGGIRDYTTENDHPQCQKQIRYEIAKSRKRDICENPNLSAIITTLNDIFSLNLCREIELIEEEEKRYWDTPSDEKICIDNRLTDDIDGNTLQEKIDRLRSVPTSGGEVDCPRAGGIYVNGPISEGGSFDNAHYCLKDRSTGYVADQQPYSPELFDPLVNDREECITRYPNGHWCGICTHRPDPTDVREYGRIPGTGCTYRSGGVTDAVLELVGGLSCLSSSDVADALSRGVDAALDQGVECLDGSVGDALECVWDSAGAGVEAVEDACGLNSNALTEQINHMMSCSDEAQTIIQAGSGILSFVPVVGPAIGLAGHIGGNMVGQCAKQTKEIIDLQGSCPNAYRDCPNYLYCEPGGDTEAGRSLETYRPGCTNENKYYPCDPRINPITKEVFPELSDEGITIPDELNDPEYRETYVCDMDPSDTGGLGASAVASFSAAGTSISSSIDAARADPAAFSASSGGTTAVSSAAISAIEAESSETLLDRIVEWSRTVSPDWTPERVVRLEECDEASTRGREEREMNIFSHEKCRACTPIANTKGLKPGDYGRSEILGISTAVAPDAYAEIDDENLDTFNNYFCIDDTASRVFRPPPAALIRSMYEQDVVHGEASTTLENFFGVDWDEDLWHGLTENAVGCNAAHYMGNLGEGLLTMGDGQGFDRNTCGLRKATYTDINPCNEGYRVAGPMHLNPFSNYDNNPCIYLNKDECNNEYSDNHLCSWKDDEDDGDVNGPTCTAKDQTNQDHLTLCNEITGDSLLSPTECEFVTDGIDLDEPICDYDPKGYCDLEESQFESNYCCKSVAGSEECPFSPIDAWSKFNFASIRDGVKLFDNRDNTLNLSMIQTGDTCGYEGNPTNPVYCHYENGEKGNPSVQTIDDEEIIKPSHPGGFYKDGSFTEMNNPEAIGPSGTRFILEGSVASQSNELNIHSREKWTTPPPITTELVNDSFTSTMDGNSYNVTQEDLDHKFCRNTRSKKYRNSFEEEINDYSTSRIYCPNLNPPDPKGDSDIHPFLISELPCLNSNMWGTLKYYSQTTKGPHDCSSYKTKEQCHPMTEINSVTNLSNCIWKVDEQSGKGECTKDADIHKLIYTRKAEDFISEKDELKKWLNESGWHSDEYLNEGISLEEAMDTLYIENEGKDCDSDPFNPISIPYIFSCVDSQTYEQTEFCNRLTNSNIIGKTCPQGCTISDYRPLPPKPGCYYLQTNSPESHSLYKTWESDFFIDDEIGMGICDIKTVKSLYDEEDQRKFIRKELTTTGDSSDICCKKGETDCIENDYDKKCVDPKTRQPIYKTFLDPISRNNFVKNKIKEKTNTDSGNKLINKIGNLFSDTSETNDDEDNDDEGNNEYEEWLDGIDAGSEGHNFFDVMKKVGVSNYSYQIDNKEDCDSHDFYSHWDPSAPGGGKCYELYKTENVIAGGYSEENSVKCGENGRSKFVNDHCIKVNMNKSDCLLSGGDWEPTKTTDSSGSSDSTGSKFEEKGLINLNQCPIQLQSYAQLKAMYLKYQRESLLSDQDKKEFDLCVKAIGWKDLCPKLDDLEIIYSGSGPIEEIIKKVSGTSKISGNEVANLFVTSGSTIASICFFFRMFSFNKNEEMSTNGKILITTLRYLVIILIIISIIQIIDSDDITDKIREKYPHHKDTINDVIYWLNFIRGIMSTIMIVYAIILFIQYLMTKFPRKNKISSNLTESLLR